MAEPEHRAPFGVRAGARTTQRRGRMSEGKRAALVDLGPRWLLPADALADRARLDQSFGRRAPRLLDIGGGTGQATRAWADAHPDHDLVALELHQPGIVRLVRDLDRGGPANVRVVEADAVAVLDAVAPETFTAVRVLFPDPWPKRRHVGRRLVDPAFVRLIVGLLPLGGHLHLATDWADYADQMRSALATDPRLEVEVEVEVGQQAGLQVEVRVDVGPAGIEEGLEDGLEGRRATGAPPAGWRSPRPDRPITAYEQRGLDAGREIVDLVAHRIR
ncbi:MAG: tRNA ((7)-)-methyltransferase [Acidimicrobiales bacterium]|nr:tRNA ((7)-)-methyltransferase [Acidimicrobiales bacterium]